MGGSIIAMAANPPPPPPLPPFHCNALAAIIPIWNFRRMTAGLPPNVRHRNLERLVVAIVQGAVADDGKRLMLVIEDAQWMNLHSMKLLLKVSWRLGGGGR